MPPPLTYCAAAPQAHLEEGGADKHERVVLSVRLQAGRKPLRQLRPVQAPVEVVHHMIAVVEGAAVVGHACKTGVEHRHTPRR